jgi:hypothetical protein
MAQLHFDPEYDPEDGSIGITLAVTEGPMREPGQTFEGAGALADGTAFSFLGQAGERRGDFGVPEADGWTTELVSADYEAGTARFRATPD